MGQSIGQRELTEIARYRMDRHTVFTDFLELAAIRISNGVDMMHFHKRDERARALNAAYTEAKHNEMFRYFQALVEEIQDNHLRGNIVDILGLLFEEYGFNRNGQDKTPQDLARLVARLSLGENPTVPPKGYFELNECSCGSGSLILAAAEAMLAKGLNYYTQLVVSATDSDLRCVHMAYIQLSLYGIPAKETTTGIGPYMNAIAYFM